MKKGFWFAIGYGLLLTAFTAYVLMDSFTISRVYAPVPPPPTFQPATLPSMPVDPSNPNTPTTPVNPDNPSPPVTYPIITENSYTDEYIAITLTEYREYETSIYVADIRVSDVRFLKAAFAKDQYGKNIKEKTSDMAEDKGAILAINGDYYGSRDVGYVLRNGNLFRDKGASDREDLIIWPDGRFGICLRAQHHRRQPAGRRGMAGIFLRPCSGEKQPHQCGCGYRGGTGHLFQPPHRYCHGG